MPVYDNKLNLLNMNEHVGNKNRLKEIATPFYALAAAVNIVRNDGV